jgi:hypothetical protein
MAHVRAALDPNAKPGIEDAAGSFNAERDRAESA